jgi:hypothetical protein
MERKSEEKLSLSFPIDTTHALNARRNLPIRRKKNVKKNFLTEKLEIILLLRVELKYMCAQSLYKYKIHKRKRDEIF